MECDAHALCCDCQHVERQSLAIVEMRNGNVFFCQTYDQSTQMNPNLLAKMFEIAFDRDCDANI